DERSYLWSLTKTSITSHVLPPRKEIEQAANHVRDLLMARTRIVKFEAPDEKRARIAQADADYPKAAATLSRMLLGPVAGQLEKKRLLVVGDGALQYVPFAALPTLEAVEQRDRGTVGQRRGENLRPNPSQSLRPSVSISLRHSFPLIVDHEIVNLPS